MCRPWLARIIVCGLLWGQKTAWPAEDAEPYLLGYRYLDGTTGPLETHAAPRGPQPEWKAIFTSAKDALARGNYFVSINFMETIFRNEWLYSRMGPTARYEAHVLLGQVLIRAGLYTNAETTLYEASSLCNEPHEAYKYLAILATLQGRWKTAQNHYKNCVFLAPTNLEYLQRLGGILIVGGSVNEGRHYLQRALDQWLAAAAPGRRDLNVPPNVNVYAWMIEYLLGTLTINWPPHGYSDGDKQDDRDFMFLSIMIKNPSMLSGRAFFDLGTALWEVGVWDASQSHMQRGLSLVKEESQLLPMKLRLAANWPLVLPGSEEREQMFAKADRLLDDFSAARSSSPAAAASGTLSSGGGAAAPPNASAWSLSSAEVLDQYPPLPVLAWQGYAALPLLSKISRNLQSYTPSLLPSPLELPPRDVVTHRMKRLGAVDTSAPAASPRNEGGLVKETVCRIGIVSAYFCEHSVGKMFLALAKTLSRTRNIRLTLFAFPTAVDDWSWKITDYAHNYIKLGAGDWVAARDRILSERMDAILWSDLTDSHSFFLGFHRVAPLQLVYSVQGLPTAMPAVDYYLLPAYLDPPPPSARSLSAQFVRLPGFGLPWDDVVDAMNVRTVSLQAPLRYEYQGQIFFESDNIYVVPAPVQQLSPEFDDVIRSLISVDDHAVVLLVGDPADLFNSHGLAFPHQWYQRALARIRKHLPRGAASRVRLLPGLSHRMRLELFRIADAILDPMPIGATVSLVEAFSLGSPVVSFSRLSAVNLSVPAEPKHGAAHAESASFMGRFMVDVLGPFAAECCVASNQERYLQLLLQFGRDPEWKLQVQRTIRRNLAAWSTETESNSAVASFLVNSIVPLRRGVRAS